MLKQVHKSFLTLILVLFIASSSLVHAEDKNIEALRKTTPEQMKLIQNDVKVNDLDIEPINTKNVKDSVVPDAKKEGKKLIELFLRTMSLVAVSAVILWFILLFVKKYQNKASSIKDDDELFEELDLGTPNTRADALKSFLNRTK